MCRNNQELKEKLFSFMITDETVDKSHFLRQLCRQMANTVCKADAVSFLQQVNRYSSEIKIVKINVASRINFWRA